MAAHPFASAHFGTLKSGKPTTDNQQHSHNYAKLLSLSFALFCLAFDFAQFCVAFVWVCVCVCVGMTLLGGRHFWDPRFRGSASIAVRFAVSVCYLQFRSLFWQSPFSKADAEVDCGSGCGCLPFSATILPAAPCNFYNPRPPTRTPSADDFLIAASPSFACYGTLH